MKLIVGINDIRIDEKDKLNAGEYNIHEVEFEFDEAYNDLIKKAVFSGNGHCYLVEIANNKCTIPYEVLSETGDVSIGAFGYAVDGSDLVLRYSPAPVYVYINLGSYKDSYDNYKQPTADVVEQLTKQIEDAVAEVEEYDGRITQNANDIDTLEQTKANISDLSDVATSGSYNDLSNKPDLSHFITKDVDNLTYYELKTATGNNIVMSINSSTYVLTISLRNSANQVLNTQTVDLPLETMVVGGSYDSTNKKIILTLKNGNTIDIPVADLVSGLQTEITSSNKLSSDLVDDTNKTNKFVTASEKTTWNGKYSKPSGGIPKTDLASDVQTSLGKADTAIQDISGKVDKVEGKGLSTNDYTTEDKTKLDSIDDIINGEATETGTGTSVTLNDTLNSLLSIELEPTELSQASTPSPSNPQTIHSISGDNTIKTENKNLWSSEWEQGGINSTTGAEFSANDTIRTKKYIPVMPQQHYAINRSITTNYINVRGYDKDKNFIGVGGDVITYISGQNGDSGNPMRQGNSYCVIAPNTGVYYLRFNDLSNNLSTQYMMTKGDVQETYIPYKSQTADLTLDDLEYCKIGDYEDKFIKTTGKNLINNILESGSQNGITYTVYEDGSVLVDGTATADTLLSITNDMKFLEVGNDYILNGGPQGGASGGFRISIRGNDIYSYDNRDAMFTLTQTIYDWSAGVSIVIPNGTSVSNKLVYPMIRKATIKNNEYEPYGNPAWYLKKNIGKIILDGSETYELHNNNRFTYRISNTQANAPIKLATADTMSPVYSTYFNASTPNITWSDTTHHLINLSNSENRGFSITKKDVGNTVEEFKTWLTTHNTTIYYPLAIPQYILLNDTLQEQLETIYNKLLSYENQTNISQVNNDLPFNLKVTGYVNTLNGMYDSLKEEKEDKSNKTTTIDENSTNEEYAGAKAIYDLVSNLPSGGGDKIDKLTYYIDLTTIEKGVYYYNTDYPTVRVYKDETQASYWSYTHAFLLVVRESYNSNLTDNDPFAVLYYISNNSLVFSSFYKSNNIISVENSAKGNLVSSAQQNFDGEKIFNTIPKQNGTTAPTNDSHFTNKKYVDDTTGTKVDKSSFSYDSTTETLTITVS